MKKHTGLLCLTLLAACAKPSDNAEHKNVSFVDCNATNTISVREIKNSQVYETPNRSSDIRLSYKIDDSLKKIYQYNQKDQKFVELSCPDCDKFEINSQSIEIESKIPPLDGKNDDMYGKIKIDRNSGLYSNYILVHTKSKNMAEMVIETKIIGECKKVASEKDFLPKM
jgi:hypothetical protein